MADAKPKVPAKKAETKPAKPDAAVGQTERRGWRSWLFGWVVTPAAVIGLIFGGGVLVGVHMHDSWFTRFVVWFVDLF
jgi:hypothetical protein